MWKYHFDREKSQTANKKLARRFQILYIDTVEKTSSEIADTLIWYRHKVSRLFNTCEETLHMQSCENKKERAVITFRETQHFIEQIRDTDELHEYYVWIYNEIKEIAFDV